MADGCQGYSPATYSGAHAPGAGTMARHLAAGPGLDRVRYSGSLGTGSTHHWPVGRRLRRGRACSADIRAVRGVPPALSGTQQAELEVAVQELPEAAGIGLANWNWRVVHRFVSERFGLSLSRGSCLNYPRFHGGGLCTGWGLPSSGPRSGCSRRTRPNGSPSWWSTPPCGRRLNGLKREYSLPTRPTSGRTPNCGASGC